jgi:hypothetical protein
MTVTILQFIALACLATKYFLFYSVARTRNDLLAQGRDITAAEKFYFITAFLGLTVTWLAVMTYIIWGM